MAALRTNLSINRPDDQAVSLGEHRRIVALFGARDMTALAALLGTHIGRTQQNFLGALEKGRFAETPCPREDYAFKLPSG